MNPLLAPGLVLLIWVGGPLLIGLALILIARRSARSPFPRPPRHFSLPLLAKELLEQAARKRTYVVRVVYASLLFCAAILFFSETLSIARATPFAALGRGREMFLALVGLQFAGIYLFMPAMTCSVLTVEKERNTLHLLFLTKLGPWTILFEKLASRLIPMFTFLFLSLPLLAFAYSLGGISLEHLASAVWILSITTLQVGALTLACSAFFRTTVGAFIGSYLLGLLFFLGPPFAYALTHMGQVIRSSGPLEDLLVEVGMVPEPGMLPFVFMGPMHFFVGAVGGAGSSFLSPVVVMAMRGVPILFSTACFLLIARVFVVRRAFAAPSNPLLGFFKRLDRVFSRMNENRVTRGVVLISDRARLPEEEPVAWRETTKKSLGTVRYLFRVFIVLEIPTALICLLLAFAGEHDSSIGLASGFLFLLWGIAVLLTAVTSASLIAGERSHQTLDVLCTTPLSGRAIVEQKMRAVRRLIWVLLIPFLTVFAFETWWKSGVTDYRYQYTGWRFDPVLYLVCSLLSLAIYLPLVAWLSLLIGLTVRSHARAIIGALAAIVAWCVMPVVFIALPLAIMSGPGTFERSGLIFTLLLSPASIIPFNEFGELHEFAKVPWVALILNFLGYGFCLAVVRTVCLVNADQFLGRIENIWERRTGRFPTAVQTLAAQRSVPPVESAVSVGSGTENT
jgi:hypothetical protein